MQLKSLGPHTLTTSLLIVFLVSASYSHSQDAPPNPDEETPVATSPADSTGDTEKIDSGDIGIKGFGIPRIGGEGEEEEVGLGNVTFSSRLEIAQGSTEGKILVTATIKNDWHVYSVTQQRGATTPTKIAITGDGIEPVDLKSFKPDSDPHINNDPLFPVPLEEHEGRVTWSAPFKLKPGTDPTKLAIGIKVTGQVCKTGGSCIPFKESLTAKFEGYAAAVNATGSFSGQDVVITGYAAPASAAPGSDVKIVITAKSTDGWHIYARKDKNESQVGEGMPTLVFPSKLDGLQFSGVATSSVPRLIPADGVNPQLRVHDGEVSWTINLRVPSDAQGAKSLAGYIALQSCGEGTCNQPEAAKFEVELVSGSAPPDSKQPLLFTKSSYKLAAEAAISAPQAIEAVSAQQLFVMIGFGLLGGLILNLMPCVLPVIGLKVLSFAEQGGQSQARVLALNFWYTLGILAVFLVLATFAAFLNLSWGQQFTYTWFKVAMVGLVFAMALSFLGVWEIPIPGFAGSSKANDLQSKEGVAGAFSKGIFTTLLATPCSGPFLGTVFGFTLGQPAYVTYVLFASVGVGMALPYLLIGAFPALVRWLPKPGEWMDTFKQVMGFVLLGTVVYLFSVIKSDYFIPTLAMMMGIWFGCWCIGRVPAWAETIDKAKGYVAGLASAGAIAAAAFYFLAPWPHLYEWKKFTNDDLARLQAEGKTVMVDFTANWCATCQVNFRWSINTFGVRDLVEKNSVVPLLADWSEPSNDIEEKLEELGSRSIPLLAIYPAGKPGEVILLRDAVTESQIVEALKKAGPSTSRGEELASRRSP